MLPHKTPTSVNESPKEQGHSGMDVAVHVYAPIQPTLGHKFLKQLATTGAKSIQNYIL
jgi:hypothetical protein